MLAANADDPEANLTLGKFLCLDQDDWDAGLPHLAGRGSTPALDLAAKSLAMPADAAAIVALGDAWWEAADIAGRRTPACPTVPVVTRCRNSGISNPKWKNVKMQPTAATGPKLMHWQQKLWRRPSIY